jgi:hypothetical protein
MWVGVLSVLLMLGALPAAHGEVYKYHDSAGHMRMTNDISQLPPDQRPAGQDAAGTPDPSNSAEPVGFCAVAPQQRASQYAVFSSRRQQARRAPLNAPQFEFEDGESAQDRRSMSLPGRVRNAGGTYVSHVRVMVEWQDTYGKVLDTRSTDIGVGVGLLPGQAKRFSIKTPLDWKTRKCRYYALAD